MTDKDETGIDPRHLFEQEFQKLVTIVVIQSLCRLIGDYQARITDDCPSHGNALLLPDAEARDNPCMQIRRKPEAL